MKKRSFQIITIIGIILVVMIAAIGMHTFIENKKVQMNEKQRVLLGRKHLKDLEQADLSVIQDKIEKHHTPEVVVEDKDVDFYKFYENTVFMGDSITEGLMEMELVNQYNVISNKGDTVDEFRKLAYEVSEDTAVNYLNIDVLVRDKGELYEQDGIHLKYDFYLKWLSYLHQGITSNN